LKRDEIIEFILQKTQIDITTQQGVEHINELFSSAIPYLEEGLFYKFGKRFKNRKEYFQTPDDIIDFLQGGRRGDRLIQCTIAKVCFCIHNVMHNERLQVIKEKTQGLLEKKFKKSLHLKEQENASYTGHIDLESEI